MMMEVSYSEYGIGFHRLLDMDIGDNINKMN